MRAARTAISFLGFCPIVMGELFHKHLFIIALFLFSFPYLKSESKLSFAVLKGLFFCTYLCLTHKQYWRGNFSQKVQAQPRAQKICDLGHEAWKRLCCDIDHYCFYCKEKPRKEQRNRQLMLNRIAGNKLHHSISLRYLF